MKKLLVFSIFLFIISLVVGYLFSNYLKKEKYNKESANIRNINVESNNVIEPTSNYSDEIKLSHDAKCIMKKYYSLCGHEEVREIELPNEMVNMTKKELSLNYPEWKIIEFSKDRVIISCEEEKACNEHFLVKLDDNIVDVYKMDNNKEYNLYKDTDISSEYLSETDVNLLKEGIYVYGISKLNKILEDYE